MRSFSWTFLFLAVRVLVQAQPPSFCFVLAEPHNHSRPLHRAVQVVHQYRERVPYVGFDGTWLKPEETRSLQAGPVFNDSTARWQVYYPVEGMAESRVLVVAGADTLRVDLPEDPQPLIERASRRWHRDTPEVIAFRKGHFDVMQLIADPEAERAANTLAKKLIAEDEAEYRKELAAQEEYYRTHPPRPPPSIQQPPAPPTAEEIMREISLRPGLKKVEVDRVDTANVWVRITGRVMLNGGCGSGMPLYGVEMRTDTGWVERIPFDPLQMDCGMPWDDWMDHTVMIPVAWWVRVHSRPREGAVKPGAYRLVFMGANMEQMRTGEFMME